MKKFSFPLQFLKAFIFILLLLPLSLAVYGQMKIGDNPTQIHSASILELESPNQALRLTQGDTAKVNSVIGQGNPANSHDTLNNADARAAEGMIMFQKSDASLYMRLGGYWHKVADTSNIAGDFWELTGNQADANSNYLGTTNNTALHLGTDSLDRIIITPSGAVHIVDSLSALHFVTDTALIDTAIVRAAQISDTLSVAGQLSVNSDSTNISNSLIIGDSIVIRGLRKYMGDTSVLTISPEGIVHKIPIDSLAAAGNLSINHIKGDNIHLKFGEDDSNQGPYIDSITAQADSTLILQIPNASGEDNQFVRGLVDTVAQSFAGNKSFRDSIAAGTTSDPNSTLAVEGNVSMAATIISNDYDMDGSDDPSFRTIICDVSGLSGSLTSASITVTLPNPGTIDGRIYTIKKIGDPDKNQIESWVKINGSFADGGTETPIYNNWSSLSLQAQNGKWYIIGH